jgi:hypothetical protein
MKYPASGKRGKAWRRIYLSIMIAPNEDEVWSVLYYVEFRVEAS